MKKLKVLFVLALFGGFLMSVVPAHSYTWVENYSGAWFSTDGNSNIIDLNVAGDFELTYDFYITDSSGTNSLKVATQGSAGGRFYVTKDSANIWWGSLTQGSTGGATDLNLGSTGYFWLMFGTETSYDYKAADPGHDYLLRFGSSSDDYLYLNGTDMAPVPIPPSALLMGSGLVGLIGFGLRRRRSRVS